LIREETKFNPVGTEILKGQERRTSFL